MRDFLAIEEIVHQGVRMNVRKGTFNRFDVGIVHEVAREYFWHELPAVVGVVVDIGAHIGSWSRRVVVEHGADMLIAIEPEPGNALLCRLNTFDLPDVEVIEGAVTYSDKPVYLKYLPTDNSGDHELSSSGEVEVKKTMTLESVLRRAGGYIDVLKMDCEKSEYDILLNCKASTLKKIGMIVGEWHLSKEKFEREVVPRLEKAGFEVLVYGRDDVDDLGMFVAKRSA